MFMIEASEKPPGKGTAFGNLLLQHHVPQLVGAVAAPGAAIVTASLSFEHVQRTLHAAINIGAGAGVAAGFFGFFYLVQHFCKCLCRQSLVLLTLNL
jgi:hypothetical protein